MIIALQSCIVKQTKLHDLLTLLSDIRTIHLCMHFLFHRIKYLNFQMRFSRVFKKRFAKKFTLLSDKCCLILDAVR